MKAEQAIQDIRIYLSSIIPDTDGEATSVDLAQRLIEVFFVEGPTIHVKHDIEVLFCFSFYLSKDSEFKFTRTYLNEKSGAYFKCVTEAREAFRVMMIHLNRMIKNMGMDLIGYRLVYNDLFSFKYEKDKDRWVARLLYGNLENLISMKKKVFQVYKDTSRNPSILIYTSEFTEKTKGDRENLKYIL